MADSGGLVAAITAAEHGAEVQLFEAHAAAGRPLADQRPAVRFHEGPHVLYADGPAYPWLRQRGLLGRTRYGAAGRAAAFRLPVRRTPARACPPLALLRVLTVRRAPVEASFTEWATARFGTRAAAVAAAAAGVGLFHPQPGDLSAAFVQERLRRVFAMPPQVGYREGGWGGMITDLAAYARRLGVQIETEARITRRPDGPTVVATSLAAARTLLADPTLTWPSGAGRPARPVAAAYARRCLRGQ